MSQQLHNNYDLASFGPGQSLKNGKNSWNPQRASKHWADHTTKFAAAALRNAGSWPMTPRPEAPCRAPHSYVAPQSDEAVGSSEGPRWFERAAGLGTRDKKLVRPYVLFWDGDLMTAPERPQTARPHAPRTVEMEGHTAAEKERREPPMRDVAQAPAPVPAQKGTKHAQRDHPRFKPWEAAKSGRARSKDGEPEDAVIATDEERKEWRQRKLDVAGRGRHISNNRRITYDYNGRMIMH